MCWKGHTSWNTLLINPMMCGYVEKDTPAGTHLRWTLWCVDVLKRTHQLEHTFGEPYDVWMCWKGHNSWNMPLVNPVVYGCVEKDTSTGILFWWTLWCVDVLKRTHQLENAFGKPCNMWMSWKGHTSWNTPLVWRLLCVDVLKRTHQLGHAFGETCDVCMCWNGHTSWNTSLVNPVVCGCIAKDTPAGTCLSWTLWCWMCWKGHTNWNMPLVSPMVVECGCVVISMPCGVVIPHN